MGKNITFRRRHERGQTIILVAISLVSLLAMATVGWTSALAGPVPHLVGRNPEERLAVTD